jgi:hypothetical protein
LGCENGGNKEPLGQKRLPIGGAKNVKMPQVIDIVDF